MPNPKISIPDYGDFGAPSVKIDKPEVQEYDWTKVDSVKLLSKFNLEEEILDQYNNAKHLRDMVMRDKSTPSNQKAQLFNTCTAILNQLSRMMTDIYNAERLKLFEQALLYTLESFDVQHKIAFLKAYEEAGVKFNITD